MRSKRCACVYYSYFVTTLHGKQRHLAALVSSQPYWLTGPMSLLHTTRALLTKTSSALKKAASKTNFIVARSIAANAPIPPEGSFKNGKPTLQYAKALPKTFASMTNEQVLQFAEMEIPEACRECIVRDIMWVDQIEYDEAMEVFKHIAETNRKGMPLAALPFYAGFGGAFTAGILSSPLVFELNTVTWFNDKFVTTEMPPPEDLETVLEVGSFSWGWMEPMLGQISFFLLCMQFARSQLQNLGIRPYYNWQRERRADYLVSQFPQYDAGFLRTYSRIDKLAEPHEMSD